MRLDDLKHVCVVGAGNMGHQIALQCALSGYTVTCYDIQQESLDKASAFAAKYVQGRVDKGKLSKEEADKTAARLVFVNDLAQAAKHADLVIEAVLENLNVKRSVFAELDKLAPPHAILASNSSMIASSEFVDVTKRPAQVLNIHFFNPALVMKLVEVVRGPHVSEESAQVCMDFCKSLGKEPILLNKEVHGFVLNRIIMAIMREALWLQEMGIASFEDIDKACVFGAGHPMGPYRLMDLVGNDIYHDIFRGIFDKSGNPGDYPPPSLVKQVVLGRLGEKTKGGWYEYS